MALGTSALAESSFYEQETRWLNQGWDTKARRIFYNAAQGSPVIPLDIFFALEQADGDGLFSEPKHLAGYGLIPEAVHEMNPRGLPVGLTIDYGLLNEHEPMLGMNCSACHVGRIESDDFVVHVDGAPSIFDFWAFLSDMDRALARTLNDPSAFERFTERLAEKPEAARARLRKAFRKRQDWRVRNNAPHTWGPGRVDALGVILNQVTAQMLHMPQNARPPDAPVSYPFLWGAPYLQFAQYNGAIPNKGPGVLARNVGQVLGVFGEVSILPATIPPGYPSTISLSALADLEGTLQTVTPPRWDDLADLGVVPPIDMAKAERGGEIYEAQCKSCHVFMDGSKPGPLGSVQVTLMDVDKIGTDPAASGHFVARTAEAGPIGGRKELLYTGEPICEEMFASAALTHVVVGVLANEASSHLEQVGSSILQGIWDAILGWLGLGAAKVEDVDAGGLEVKDLDGAFSGQEDQGAAEAEQILEGLEQGDMQYRMAVDGCGTPARTAQYRSRPLNGIWATGPFLHNGSVPSLAALLEKAADRPETFYVGSMRIDAVNLGFESAPDEGRFLFDTKVPGNSNAGHEYGTILPPEDKAALLEFLKTL